MRRRGRRLISRRDAGVPSALERRRLGGWPGGVLAAVGGGGENDEREERESARVHARAMISRYVSALRLKVRFCVAKSTWMMPKRFV